MQQALELASRGLGTTSPNPPVGAIVVRDRRVIAAAFHRRAGGPHAELFALRRAGRKARGATLYVTLEPCSHRVKRTPPCVPVIIDSGIRRVVVATRDPNPQVNGRGLAALRRAGLKVDVGVGRLQADALLEPYRLRVTTGRPFVTLKVATTLDGKIATARGESRWITGLPARRLVQELRARSDAVLVGIGTVLADDPSLTVRLKAGGSPRRVILDPHLKIPLSSRVLTDGKATTMIVTTDRSSRKRRERLQRQGADVLVLPGREGRIAWARLLKELGRRGINTLLIEGGAEVNATALRAGIVHRIIFFLAPQLLGGRDAIGAIGGASPTHLAEAVRLRDVTVSPVGKDFMVQARVKGTSWRARGGRG